MIDTRDANGNVFVSVEKTYNYIVAGLTVRSEIELPELVPLVSSNDVPDIEIRFGSVPESLPHATRATFESEIAENDVLLKIPDVARYFIKTGCEILVEATPNVHAKDLRLYLLGSALGAVYLQRGYFPFHASVVVVNGNAVAFTGDSGAGKSTMAAWMNAQGYPLLCDDVCVIRLGENDVPMAYSSFPRLKLWGDALDAFEIDTSELHSDYYCTDKYHLPAKGNFCIDPVPLRRIHILQFSAPDGKTCIENINPARAVHLLRNNTYRFQYISGLGLTRSHFIDCVQLARKAHVHFLTRPRQYKSLPDCQRLIEEQMA